MKFIVLIGDGMGDYPQEDRGGKTLLELAETPNMDWIAAHGRGGLSQTIPLSMQPGSDVANMEIMGYDTTKTFTGRAVFEALNKGRRLGDDDVAFRANFVTLENGIMKDYSAGHITTEESRELMKILDEALGSETLRFYPGVSYRNLVIWTGGTDSMETTPPHDIIGREFAQYLPKGKDSETIRGIMRKSQDVLAETMINKKRVASGLEPATSLWLWGQGRKLDIPTIGEKFGLKGAVISAVDLINGIGVAAGLESIFVPGMTGYVDTNFAGKAAGAIEALKTKDFIYLHVEAPDEAGHNGSRDLKIQAIEDFDAKVVGVVLDEVKKRDDLAVFVTCDHRTPVAVRTHTREPVPFAYYGPGIEPDGISVFSEAAAEAGSVKMMEGNRLMNLFIGEFA